MVSALCEGSCGSGRVQERGGETGDAPTVSLDYVYMRSEQDKEEEKGMPIVVVKARDVRRKPEERTVEYLRDRWIQRCAVGAVPRSRRRV